MMYYVYILQSSKSNILYYGYTTDLRKRFQEHNDGRSKFTKGHIPWKLVWYSAFDNKQKAKDFELYLKSGSGKAFAYKRLVSVALSKDVSVHKLVFRSRPYQFRRRRLRTATNRRRTPSPAHGST